MQRELAFLAGAAGLLLAFLVGAIVVAAIVAGNATAAVGAC